MVECPIVNNEIDEATCCIISDVSERFVKESVLAENVTNVENWREICKNCKWHGM